MIALVMVTTFSLAQCMRDAAIRCEEVVRSDPSVAEAADGTTTTWLADCRRAAVELCLAKADRHEHFGQRPKR